MLNAPSDETRIPAKLKRDKNFQPCPAESGDEHYLNGVFEFNITRLLAFIDTCAERFPIEFVAVAEFPAYGASHLDEETVRTARICLVRSCWPKSPRDVTTSLMAST